MRLEFGDKIILHVEGLDPDNSINALRIEYERGAFAIKPEGIYDLLHKLSPIVREWSRERLRDETEWKAIARAAVEEFGEVSAEEVRRLGEKGGRDER